MYADDQISKLEEWNEKALSEVPAQTREFAPAEPDLPRTQSAANAAQSQECAQQIPPQTALIMGISSEATLGAMLDERKIDHAHPPPPPIPIYSLAGQQICTEGNLCVVSGPPKGAKSTALGAMVASALSGDSSADTFGFKSPKSREGAIFFFDCEQSPYDAFDCGMKILHRAGLQDKPERFTSYCLTDVEVAIRRKMLALEMKRAALAHGSIHSVFVDGVADLCLDPNDAAEAFDLVQELHALAIKYHTALILVLHENPGGMANGKTRGHLGSQLERKAESNLRLVKNDKGVTEIYGERCRHAHIPKGTGPCFKFDLDKGMHVTCESATTQKANDRSQELGKLVEEVFADRMFVNYNVLKERIASARQLKAKSAENWVKKLIDAGLIRKNDRGDYVKHV